MKQFGKTEKRNRTAENIEIFLFCLSQPYYLMLLRVFMTGRG
jgi:hypothetical protein